MPGGGPLAHLLVNPGAIAHHAWHAIAHDAPVYGPILAAVLAGMVIVALTVRARLRARRHAAYTARARIITVLAPPKVDPHGAEALWSHLLGLLRPPRARLLSGQPHLGFE